MKWSMLLLAVLLVMAAPARAQAPCNGTMDNIAFGQLDPLDSTSTDVTGNLTVSCSGHPAPYVRLCVSLAAPGGLWTRSMNNGADRLVYEIYKDAARTQVWDSINHNPSGVVTVDLTLVSGAGSVQIPYYARVQGPQSGAPAGAYSVNWTTSDTQLSYASYASTPPTCGPTGWAITRFTFTVSATVAANCAVSASNVAFGSVGVLNNPLNATGLITATCTKGSPYSISLNAGTGAGATVASRRLTRSGGGTLTYGLYQDSARSQSWGDGTGGTTTVSSTGIGTAQTHTVYATLPAQATPAVGAYTDTIIVTVTY